MLGPKNLVQKDLRSKKWEARKVWRKIKNLSPKHFDLKFLAKKIAFRKILGKN